MAREKFHGKRLLLIRTYLGLSLQDLANVTDISKQTLSRYENSKVRLSLPNMLAIVHVLNLDANIFYSNDIRFDVKDGRIRIFRGNEIVGWCPGGMSKEKLIEMMLNRKKDLK